VSEEGHIRVFLLDDHEGVRRGVHALLSTEPAIDIVGEAAATADAMAGIASTHPDVAVLDVRLPDGSEVEICREIRSRDPSVKCLMLTSFADGEALFDAIMAGAAGYVPKVVRGGELIEAVKQVAAGTSLLDPSACGKVMARLREGGTRWSGSPGPSGGAERQPGEMSRQELRMLDLIGQGRTNRQIGERLDLSEKTVRSRVSSLLARLGMRRRTQAAVYVARAARGRDGRGA
jgi:two-component system response regulator DevR